MSEQNSFRQELRNARDAFMMDAFAGPDDQASLNFAIRERREQDKDSPRPEKMVAENPLIYRLREMMGKADPTAEQVRAERGFGRITGPGGTVGHLGGAVASDLITDRSRSVWWLLNAAQATGNVINELVMGRANRDLYNQEDLGIDYSDLKQLEEKGYARRDQSGKIRPLPTVVKGAGNRAKLKNYASGAVLALGAPAGFAINQGLGLMTPFGGYEGYEAVVPDENDKSKTSNVVGEIATKYFLGRTGQLLPWDEFKQVRPDVSKGEYLAYKAFKFDKNPDYNITDGDFTTHSRILKGTMEGIHGPELQFLGRSLPVNTALLPFASAVVGAAAGVRPSAKYRKSGGVDPDAVKRGLMGGTAGALGGMAIGNTIEAERRRRNQAENEAYYASVDKLDEV